MLHLTKDKKTPRFTMSTGADFQTTLFFLFLRYFDPVKDWYERAQSWPLGEILNISSSAFRFFEFRRYLSTATG